MKPNETIDFPLRWAWHGVQRHYNTVASRYDMSMTMGYVLLNIDNDGGTPSTQLGPKIGMEPGSLTRTLKTMEDKGYICKESDEQDKRKVRICLTKLGEEKRLVSKLAVLQFNEFFSDKLTSAQKENFFEVMDILNLSLQEHNVFEDFDEKIIEVNPNK